MPSGHGPRRLDYSRFGLEDVAWATAATVWTGIPHDEYTVEPENEMTLQAKFDGNIDPLYLDPGAQDVRGSMTIQAWPDIITLLLDFCGLPRDVNGEVPSFTFQGRSKSASGIEFIQQVGLRADTWRIEAAANDPVRFSYDLIGKRETTVASFTEPSFPSQLPFKMGHISDTAGGHFNVVVASEDPSADGSNEPNLNRLTIEGRNNLAPSERRDENGTIVFLDSGDRTEITLTFVVTVRTDLVIHYRDAVRLGLTNLGFDVQFDYPGTGSPADTFGLEFGKCGIRSARRVGAPGDSETWEIVAVASKPAAQAAVVSRVDGVVRPETS